MAPITPPPKKRAHGVRWRDREGRYVTKLNQQTIERVGKAIRAGTSIEGVARYIGVSKETLDRWRREGVQPDASPLLQQFAEEIEAAIGDFEVLANEIITEASNQQWQAAAWKLERRFPQTYGRRSRLDVGNPEGEVFKVLAGQFDLALLDGFTPEELEQFKGFLLRLVPQQVPNVIDMPIRQIEA
jgi:hypothetical protein